MVEDDADLSRVVARGLRHHAYAVDVATTVREGEDALTSVDYDVAIVDLGLPDGDGLDLIARLGEDPVLRRPRRTLVLTARDSVASRVAGLDAGADDYLIKPFDFAELLARLRALGRRADERASIIEVGELSMDLDSRRVTRSGRPVELTAREFAVLRHLAGRPGRVVPAEELVEHVWDANANPFTTSPRVILSRLRRKLGAPSPIETITGAGYRLLDGPVDRS